MSLAWMVTLPGLPHRLEHGDDGVATLTALRGVGGALEGDRLVGAGDADVAFAHAAREVAGLGCGVVLGPVQGWLDGMPTGLGAHRLRVALRFARVGEVLALQGVGALPEGVGRFDAPRPIMEAVGCRVELLKDFR